MDGIAVRSANTVGANEQNPVTLPDAARVNTGGNIVPPGYDAVIMIEDVWVGSKSDDFSRSAPVERRDGETYTVRKPVSPPWQHVRPVGEDIGESEMILPRGAPDPAARPRGRSQTTASRRLRSSVSGRA